MVNIDSRHQPVRVDVLSSSERVRQRFETVFHGPLKGLCMPVNATVAEVAVIDLDSVPTSVRDEYRARFPDRPIIALSDKEWPGDSYHALLKKPLQIAELAQALEHVRNSLDQVGSFAALDSWSARDADGEPATIKIGTVPDPEEVTSQQERLGTLATGAPQESLPDEQDDRPDICGTADDVDASDPLQVQATLLPIHHRLLGFIKSSLKKSESIQTPIALRFENYQLVVDTARQLASRNIPEALMKTLCQGSFSPADIKTQPVTSEAPYATGPAPMETWLSETVDSLLWKLALWTYQGRLPIDTQLDRRVYLVQWPNFTRLHPVPNAMRMAALWTEQPMSLLYTAKLLQVPQRQVFAFYSASHTIGLAGQAKRDSDYLFQERWVEQRDKRPGVGIVMKRLKGMVSGGSGSQRMRQK